MLVFVFVHIHLSSRTRHNTLAALVPGYSEGQCVRSWMMRSRVYLARSLFNPAVKSFTDAAVIFSDAQALGMYV